MKSVSSPKYIWCVDIWIWKQFCCEKKIHLGFLYCGLIAVLLQPRHFELYTSKATSSNLHINKIFISYIFPDLIFMNWHTQLLFTQKIIINNLPCIQKRPGNISNPSWSIPEDCVACIFYFSTFNTYLLRFIRWLDFALNIKVMFEIYTSLCKYLCIAPISQHNKFLLKACHIHKMEEWNAHWD